MKKLKLSVGVLAFAGLATLNFTQSESCFVSKALASGGAVNSESQPKPKSSSSSWSSFLSSTSSNSLVSISSSADNPNLKKNYKLEARSCTITITNLVPGFVWNGEVIPVGSTYQQTGIEWVCVPSSAEESCDVTKEVCCMLDK